MTNHIQFPGLGLEFTVNRVAFSIGGMAIYWYGILLATGLLLGILFAFYYAIDYGIDSDRFVDVVCVGTVMAIVCARIYYVTFVPYEYNSIWEILDIRDGGIGMYGSLIGAFVFGGLTCKLRKLPVLPVFDVVAIGFLIGQGVGRWGNFVNQEAFGTNTTLPWGMISETTRWYLTNNQALLAAEGVTVDPNLPVHPTFLYESITCLIGFLLLWALMRRRKYNGEIFIWYLIWNGANRFWIESLRTDSLMFSVEMNLRTSQVLAMAMVIVGLAVDLVMRRRAAGTTLMVPMTATSELLKRCEGHALPEDSLPASASHAAFKAAAKAYEEKLKAIADGTAETEESAEKKPEAPLKDSDTEKDSEPENTAQDEAEGDISDAADTENGGKAEERQEEESNGGTED